jgi:hypothetical protein
VIILLEQGIPETQVPSTMPQGKAIDVRDRQFVVRLKDYFDQECHQGLSVSTQDPAGRVAKALGVGQRTVKAIRAYSKVPVDHAVLRSEREGKETRLTCQWMESITIWYPSTLTTYIQPF